MSEWPWATPEATRTALSALISGAYPDEQRAVRMREVAYRRLLARLFAARPGGWVVKGGVSLILQLDPNRTSNDIDLSFLDRADDHTPALKALRMDASTDLGDFFVFEVGEATDGARDDGERSALEVPILAKLGSKEWARFSVDLNLPDFDLPTVDLSEQTELTGREVVDRVPGARALALPQQIADKICAIHEVHGHGQPSSRARDLADLALIATQMDGLDGADVTTRTTAEGKRRHEKGTLPIGLPDALSLTPTQEED